MMKLHCYKMSLNNMHSLTCAFRLRYGLRTIDEIENLSGIAGYGVAAVPDQYGGIGLTEHPPFQFVPSAQEQFTIGVPKYRIGDGDVIVIWFTVSDIAGNRDDVRLTVGLDRSPPEIDHDEFRRKTVDEFTST